MKEKGATRKLVLLVLSVSLIAVSVVGLFLTEYFSGIQYRTLGNLCGQLVEKAPDSEVIILEILKKGEFYEPAGDNENMLAAYGYGKSDFRKATPALPGIMMVGLIVGVGLFLLAFFFWQRRTAARVNRLTEYLEKVNTGKPGLLLDTVEDEFSRLQDEIYKTITELYQTRDEAVAAKCNFAENLSNIAHQLKTPITAISLSNQMLKRQINGQAVSDHPILSERKNLSEYSRQIEGQLHRLTHLEEALLLLSRIDAGTLALKKQTVDVFTVLTLAADNLQELFAKQAVTVDIPECGEITITADLEWTMEAVMNLLKNCMEHSPAGGVVRCFYEKNPLYVQIQIWDEGTGFGKEELPHLFERFYRGENAGENGIGIGLSLSKSIIEMQNGIISAFNRQSGGACFEIRFYCH